MTFIEITNPIRTETGVILTVTTEQGKVIDFHATPTDTEEYGRDLYSRAMALEFGPFASYEGGTLEMADKLSSLRSLARKALRDSDITVIRCYEHSLPVPAAWVSYRSALRSILNTNTWTESLELPAMPGYPAGT